MTVYTFDVTYTEGPRSVTSSQRLPVYDAKASELLFNGANAGTVFTDTTGRVWTRNGNAQTSTAQFTEGTASMLLDGTGDFLTTPSTTDLQNHDDWRIECAVRPATVAALRCIFGKRPASGNTIEYAAYLNAGGTVNFGIWDAAGSGAQVLSISGTTALAINSWYDLAFEKNGDNYRILVNNTEDAVGTQSGAPGVFTNDLYIGRDRQTTTRDFNGYIDRFRFLRA